MGFLADNQLTSGNVTILGNQGITIDWGTLETDRYGLSTMRSVYTTQAANIQNRGTSYLPNVYSTHPLFGFLQCEHRSMNFKNGYAVATCDYAGLDPSIVLTPIYELVVGLSSEPITTHPLFVTNIGGTAASPLNGAIFEHYGNDGSVDTIAPPAVPTDNSNWLFKLFALFNADGTQNPFAGIEDYLAATEVTWKASSTSANPLPGLGTSGQVAVPAGPYPESPSGYTNFNWLDMGYNQTQRGSAYSWSHEWRLSGPRGWNSVIYGA